MEPDEEERAELQKNIQIALQTKEIDIEDSIDINQIKNLKLANEMLKLKRKKKQEREQAKIEGEQEDEDDGFTKVITKGRRRMLKKVPGKSWLHKSG